MNLKPQTSNLKPLFLIALAAVVFLGTALRVSRLDADAPASFPNGMSSSAPYKDESAKGFAPRSRALFGAWSPSPADDYRFWEILSPVWTWSLWGWFEAFGAGTKPARWFSVLWSAVSLLAVYLALAPRGRWPATFAAALLAVNFYAVIYGRLGLMETMLNALLLIAFAWQARSPNSAAGVIAASIAWLMAWFVKQSAALYGLVPLAGAALLLPRSRKSALIAGAAFGACLAAALLPLLDFDYRFRTVVNFRHAMTYMPDHSRLWMEISAARTWEAIRGNLTGNLWRGYFLMSPAASVLALLELAAIARDLVRRRADRLGLLAAAWWLGCRFFITIQGQTSERFYLPALPPTFILAGLAVQRLFTTAGPTPARRRVAGAAVAAILAAETLFQIMPWAAWQAAYPRDLSRASAELSRIIGPTEAVVIGEWAPPLTFDTPYRTYFVKNVFNRTQEQMAALGPTHLIVSEGKEEGEETDPAVRRLSKFFPSVYDHRRETGRIRLWPESAREQTLIVYEITMEAQ